MDWLTANEWWIRLLVEIGIFAGVVWLVHINKYHYNQSLRAKEDQIKLKDEQIALLERTKIENVMAKLDAMKSYIKESEEGYEKKINEIEAAQKDKDKLIADLRGMLKDIETRAETTTLAASGFYNALARALSETKDKE